MESRGAERRPRTRTSACDAEVRNRNVRDDVEQTGCSGGEPNSIIGIEDSGPAAVLRSALIFGSSICLSSTFPSCWCSGDSALFDLLRFCHLVADRPRRHFSYSIYMHATSRAVCSLKQTQMSAPTDFAPRHRTMVSYLLVAQIKHFVAQSLVSEQLYRHLIAVCLVLLVTGTTVCLIVGMIGFSEFPVIEFVLRFCVPASALAGALRPSSDFHTARV